MTDEVKYDSNQSTEMQLHFYMASLKLNSQIYDKPDEYAKDEEKINVTPKMAFKKKNRSAVLEKTPERTNHINRRVKLVPKKLHKDQLKELYTNLNIKAFPKSGLETIFEEPHNNEDKVIYIGASKLRRSLNLKSNSIVNKKVEKRKGKIKRFFGNINKFHNLSGEQLITKLSVLDDNEE